jgi:predicted O-methyltransferase YrrM
MIQLPFDVVSEYCAKWSSQADELLNELERETHLKTVAPQMLSGGHQGRFLEILSKLLRPKRILEIGSFTGYSAICFARGLQEGGMLDAIEFNPEYASIFHKYVKAAGLDDRITLHNGDALKILDILDGPYDIVFIDANKVEYQAYYEKVLPLTRQGGAIIFDNLLWEGKVFGETDDKDGIAMRALAKSLHEDDRIERVMLPLRDGVLMTRKKILDS